MKVLEKYLTPNNDFEYPVAVAEKRAVDRAILKALGIHGKYYSDVEMPPQPRTENQGVDLDHSQIVLDRINAASHQANWTEIMSDNKEFVAELSKKILKKAQTIKDAFENKMEQLKGEDNYMAQYDKSKANPDLIGNFVLVRNKQKTEVSIQIGTSRQHR